MTEYPTRTFKSDAEIERIGEGLLARTLPRGEWTHEAHLAATTWLLIDRRADVDIDAELPGIIRRYNESVGGVNSDSEGYHETITRVFLRGVRLFLEGGLDAPLYELVNELLLSPMGRRDWPLRFYSRERLFCVEARRELIPPDLAALP